VDRDCKGTSPYLLGKGGHLLNSPLFNVMVQNEWVTKIPSTSGKLVKMRKSSWFVWRDSSNLQPYPTS